MPIYDFLCHDCMYEFEKHCSIDSNGRTQCLRCESKDAWRIPSLPAHAKGNFGTVPRNPTPAITKKIEGV